MLNIQKYNSDLQCTVSAQTSHIPWACAEKGIKFLSRILSGQESQHPPVGITRQLKPQHTFLQRCSTSVTLADLKTPRALRACVNPLYETTGRQSATESSANAQKTAAKPYLFLHCENMIPTAIILGNKLELPLNKPGVQFIECAEGTNWTQMNKGRVFSVSFLKAALGW